MKTIHLEGRTADGRSIQLELVGPVYLETRKEPHMDANLVQFEVTDGSISMTTRGELVTRASALGDLTTLKTSQVRRLV